METQVRTPQLIFMQPQRLTVPLFQRPYVWNEESQWEPLWNDVARTADRLIKNPGKRQQPHFLGAVVVQQIPQQIGLMQQRTIIDGQQRLTTLQLLLDALHGELLSAGVIAPAKRIESLIVNAEHFCSKPEDRFKVWPTNRDRPAFNAVMGSPPPVNYDLLGHSNERMVMAHRYFAEQAREWLYAEDTDQVSSRGSAIETVVRDLLQMVVIDLASDENAQEIFETLNSRGAQLTAADLIKNLVFQRLLESGADVEVEYRDRWKEFESAFWETELSVGRMRHPRSSLFLNHWLISLTGEEIVAREVFSRFKNFADFDSGLPMGTLLTKMHRAAGVYRAFVEQSSGSGAIDYLALFGYRTGVLESEVVKPFVMWLLDPERPSILEPQLRKALQSVESWMVRRMLVRATTKAYNQVFAELVRHLNTVDRGGAGDAVEAFLMAQSSDSRHWPGDDELRQELSDLMAYRRLGRGRLRMVLEAVEDHVRGWRADVKAPSGERISRATHAIEHIMPRKWQTHWPLPVGISEQERERLIHTLGNLTLLTGKINSKASNAAWTGPGSKSDTLIAQDAVFMNRPLVKSQIEPWTEARIQARTGEMVETILRLWAVPPGHKPAFVPDRRVRRTKSVGLTDLLAAAVLQPGDKLHPRKKQFAGAIATVLGDGTVELNGVVHTTPTEAARAITKGKTGGWWFFLVDNDRKRSLRNLRRDYIKSMAVDADDDDEDDEDEDEG